MENVAQTGELEFTVEQRDCGSGGERKMNEVNPSLGAPRGGWLGPKA